jgi:hypothetical protein|uniref:Uncharacterized protein n=1 Tax=viral metagenome TaxID=1070528 RepID=A0A6C0JRL2_9ZZZZ
MIWDSLPDCLLETIYKKIVISQPNNLLKDIKSYKNTIDYINDNLEQNQFVGRYNEWLILIYILNIYFKKETLEYRTNKFIKLEMFIQNTNNLQIKYQGGFYWINRYVAKMSISERNSLVSCLNGDNL